MNFDPFLDFETRGYLPNFAGEKDPEIIKRLEHRAFLAKLNVALKTLASARHLSYQNVLDTHKTLFGAVYPWAGQDRNQTAPDIAVSKGSILFAHPRDARGAVEYALTVGQDKTRMRSKPGEVMGYLCYGHPFLDGNGRTILTVHTELAQRAGIGIRWAATGKTDYLMALSRELEKPGEGHPDSYLARFVYAAIDREQLATHVARAPGLDGSARHNANEVAGRFSDPAVQARYQAQERRRGQASVHRDVLPSRLATEQRDVLPSRLTTEQRDDESRRDDDGDRTKADEQGT